MKKSQFFVTGASIIGLLSIAIAYTCQITREEFLSIYIYIYISPLSKTGGFPQLCELFFVRYHGNDFATTLLSLVPLHNIFLSFLSYEDDGCVYHVTSLQQVSSHGGFSGGQRNVSGTRATWPRTTNATWRQQKWDGYISRTGFRYFFCILS